MVKREKVELAETLKAEAFDVDAIVGQFEILEVKDQATKHGDKIILTLRNNQSGDKNSLFVNMYSNNAMIDKFGDDDKMWIGKLVEIVCQNDEHFNNKMLVCKPL